MKGQPKLKRRNKKNEKERKKMRRKVGRRGWRSRLGAGEHLVGISVGVLVT